MSDKSSSMIMLVLDKNIKFVAYAKNICCLAKFFQKLKKGKTAAVIAEELEEDPALVESICKTAENSAPDYDTGKIYAALREKMA